MTLARQLGAALDGAHALGVIHRDVKPSNVMLPREPGHPRGVEAVLIDFGIARLGPTRAGTGSVALGTIEHMAPEVARGEPATARTDVYLLAHVLYRVLTGRRQTTGQIRPPSRVSPRFGPEVDAVFLDALADEPEDRPGSCGELARRLSSALELGEQQASPRRPTSSRHGLLLLGGVAVVVVGLALRQAGQRAEGTATGPGSPAAAAAPGAPPPTALTPIPTPTPVPTTGDFALTLPDGSTMAMVRVPGGTFQMGSPAGEGESDEHAPDGGQVAITLAPYALGKYEVTNAQYAAFLSAHGSNDCTPPGGTEPVTCVEEGSGSLLLEKDGTRWRPKAGKGDFPVVEVSWHGARAFADWAKARLPTEAEWEGACRAGVQATWAGTNTEAQLTTFANVADQAAKRSGVEWPWVKDAWAPGDDRHAGLAPVGQLARNPLGLHDLSGNVWEWTASEYTSTLSVGPATSAVAPTSGAQRAVRGGSFGNSPDGARCANRFRNTPTVQRGDLGFRVALSASPQRR